MFAAMRAPIGGVRPKTDGGVAGRLDLDEAQQL